MNAIKAEWGQRCRVFGRIGWVGCAVPIICFGGALASDCYVIVQVACCVAPPEVGCGSGSGPSPEAWTCKGTAEGPGEIGVAESAGSSQSGQTSHDSGDPQLCTETSFSCGTDPGTCIAEPETKYCANTFLTGSSCTGGGGPQ